MHKFGTEVQVTGNRHDTEYFPTAVVVDSNPVSNGGIRYRAIFIPANNGECLIETNLYSDETGSVVTVHGVSATVELIRRCGRRYR